MCAARPCAGRLTPCSFAFATFESVEQANKAVAAKPTLKSGRTIRVESDDPNHVVTRVARCVHGGRRAGSDVCRSAPRAEGEARPPRAPRAPRAPRVYEASELDSKRVFIGYLPEGVVEEQVRKSFAGVVTVELRGKYGYVTFDSDASAQTAIKKHETPVFGQNQNVKVEAANRPARPPRAPRAPKAEAST